MITDPVAAVRASFLTALRAQVVAEPVARPEPQDGPQRAFVETTADIAVYGGSAGGGKTWSLLMEPVVNERVKVPGFGAVVFRRTYPDITAEGGMWDETQDLYPDVGAKSRENPLEWRFPSGAKVRFAHMQHVKDRLRWKGAQIPYIAFDQLEEFEEAQFWYLLSRNRSTCGVRPYVRATVNPDPDSWVKGFLAPWVDDEHPEYPFPPGVLRYFTRDGDDLVWVDADWRDEKGDPPVSLTYIPASIYDNKILLERDPDYVRKLRALPLVDRERLLEGNWSIRAEGNTLKREWFKIVDEAPADLDLIGRSWDLAATEKAKDNNPDWTAGALIGMKGGVWYILDLDRTRLTPSGVDALMDQRAALDGWQVPILLQQDPGEAGKRAVLSHAARLVGYDVRFRPPTGDKRLRARPLASAAEAGNVRLVKGPWNRDFLNEAVAFPGGAFDDQIDAVSWGMLMLVHGDGGDSAAPIPPGLSLVGGTGLRHGG